MDASATSSFKLTSRLRKHQGDPRYTALAERLEALKERRERGLLNNIEFLKQLLELAKDVLAVEKEAPPRRMKSAPRKSPPSCSSRSGTRRPR